MADPRIRPTPEHYRAFQQAFDFFNDRLFDNSVPPVLITMQTGKGFRGFFAKDRFKKIGGEAVVHELAMNPESFLRPTQDVLSTLVHEMVHAQHAVLGTPSRRGYHNKEWASLMKKVGLMPSHTGQPGGKETGQRVTHYVVENGRFHRAYKEFERLGFQIPFGPNQRTIDTEVAGGVTAPMAPPGQEKKQTRVKYRCPCGDQAWGKPGLAIHCKKCNNEFVLAPSKSRAWN